MAVSWRQESRVGRSCPQVGSSPRDEAFIPTGLNLNSWPPVPSQVPGHGTTRAPLAINEELRLHPPHTWPPPCRRSVLPPPEKQPPLRCHLLLSRTVFLGSLGPGCPQAHRAPLLRTPPEALRPLPLPGSRAALLAHHTPATGTSSLLCQLESLSLWPDFSSPGCCPSPRGERYLRARLPCLKHHIAPLRP